MNNCFLPLYIDVTFVDNPGGIRFVQYIFSVFQSSWSVMNMADWCWLIPIFVEQCVPLLCKCLNAYQRPGQRCLKTKETDQFIATSARLSISDHHSCLVGNWDLPSESCGKRWVAALTHGMLESSCYSAATIVPYLAEHPVNHEKVAKIEGIWQKHAATWTSLEGKVNGAMFVLTATANFVFLCVWK